MILDSTLRENLKYGNKENIDDSKLIQLVEDFKLFKESNVDLNLMVNNKSLSSGQMQKISFIRALISNSDILFLDESTSI